MRMARFRLHLLGLIALQSISVATHAQDRAAREAAAQAMQADRLFKAGQYAPALKLYRAERESRKAGGDARYEAHALRGIGCCLVGLGEEEDAIAAFREARTIDATREDKGFEGYDGLLIAQAERRLGRPADAVATLEAAVPKLDGAADRDHECDARLDLVGARLELGEPARARADAARAIALAVELKDPRRLADAWCADGLIDRALDRPGPAFERLVDARDAYREQGRDADVARTTRLLADLSARLGHPERAARRFEEAAEAHAKLGDVATEAEDRLDLATLRLDLGDPEAAVREASRARDGFLAGRDERSAIAALVVLAQARSRMKDGLADSAATIRDAIDRSSRVHRDEPAERVRLLLLSAEVEGRLGRKAEVAARLEAARASAAATGDDGLRRAVADAAARLNPGP